MPTDITSVYTQQFKNNIVHQLQQMDSRFRGKASEASGYTGKQANPVDLIGSVEMQEVDAKNQTITFTEPDYQRRWVAPRFFDLAQKIETMDKLQMLADPTSNYVQNALMAAKRSIDNIFISAAHGSALTGETAGTSTAFVTAATNVVAVDVGSTGATGMNVAKLDKLLELALTYEIDLESEPLYLALCAKQIMQLQKQYEVRSKDFNWQTGFRNNIISSYGPIQFVPSQKLVVDGSSYRRLIAWTPAGMHLGVWADVTARVTVREDLRMQPIQVYTQVAFNWTRTDEKRVFEIKVSES